MAYRFMTDDIVGEERETFELARDDGLTAGRLKNEPPPGDEFPTWQVQLADGEWIKFTERYGIIPV